MLWKGVDAGLIDGAVNGVGSQSRGIGGVLRMLQSGNIRNYATWVVFGSVLVLRRHRAGGRRAMTLLDVVIFLPLVAFLCSSVLPNDNPADPTSALVHCAAHLRGFARA